MLFVIGGKAFVHFVYVVNAFPCGIFGFRVPSVGRDFEIVHIAVRRRVNVTVESLEHFAFGFSLNDSFDDC